MARDASQVLAAFAIGYGVAAALSVLLQARQMLARGGSCDVSAPFLGAYVGGYATWLLYGLSVRNVPIIVVDAVGLVCGAFTLVVALRLRGRLVSPARRLGLGRATRRFGTRRAGPTSR
jgi:fructose-specific phosphotransferase system IIC component